MHWTRMLALTGLLAVPALAPRDAAATTFMKTTLEQRVDMADVIVRGTVTEVWTERDDNGVIWTRAQVEVDRVLKGDADLETVVVDQLGGEWAGMHMAMPGASRYSVGEDLVVMVQELESGYMAPVGMFQGKYTVAMDPRIREKIAVRFYVANHRKYDHRFAPLPDESDVVTVADLESRILDAVRKPGAPASVEVK
ncbi:MAG: hypothetical protein VX265_09415 [Myxococcota bacterium]|nr:hypothetical protein [Myxococcota bacterium]